MKWGPVLDKDEEKQLTSGYVSDNTSFLRMQTQIEKKDKLIDDDFFRRHPARIISCDKFAPLANIQDYTQIELDRVRRLKIDLLEEAGLYEDAEKAALDNIADFQDTRGYKGFFQQAQITERHILKQSTDTRLDKAGRFSNVFKRKKPEEEEQE